MKAILVAAFLLNVLFSTLNAAVTVSSFTSTGYPLTVNYTTAGPLGWVHWGGTDTSPTAPGYDTMNGGAVFSNYTATGATPSAFFNDANLNFSWSNGTNVAVEPDASTGIIASADGFSVRFTLTPPVALKPLSVFVYANLFNTTMTLTATQLSNGDVGTNFTSAAGAPIGYFRIDYTPTSLTDTLTIDLAKTASGGNIVLYGAALVPEPSKAMLFLMGAALCLFKRRRNSK